MRQERIAAPTKVSALTATNVGEATYVMRQGLLGSECRSTTVVEACRRLLTAGSMMGVIVEATEPPGNNTVVGLGAGAFVSRDFVHNECCQSRPGLTERVLKSSLTGCPTTLNRREIEEANAAEGLYFAILFHHWHPSAPPTLQSEVRRHLQSRLFDDLRGYNLVELVSEGWVAHMPWALAGGFRLRDAYDDWYREHEEPQPRRCLMGLSRDEARSAEGSAIAMMFNHTPARLRLTASQRRLLRHAIQHKTDADISNVLGVSLSAVKKTWAAIFEKAGQLLPSMGESECSAGALSTRPTRGAQKRHTLLTYLHEHPEELRP